MLSVARKFVALYTFQHTCKHYCESTNITVNNITFASHVEVIQTMEEEQLNFLCQKVTFLFILKFSSAEVHWARTRDHVCEDICLMGLGYLL